jgi:hypothetical protein
MDAERQERAATGHATLEQANDGAVFAIVLGDLAADECPARASLRALL